MNESQRSLAMHRTIGNGRIFSNGRARAFERVWGIACVRALLFCHISSPFRERDCLSFHLFISLWQFVLFHKTEFNLSCERRVTFSSSREAQVLSILVMDRNVLIRHRSFVNTIQLLRLIVSRPSSNAGKPRALPSCEHFESHAITAYVHDDVLRNDSTSMTDIQSI